MNGHPLSFFPAGILHKNMNPNTIFYFQDSLKLNVGMRIIHLTLRFEQRHIIQATFQVYPKVILAYLWNLYLIHITQ